VGDPLEDRPDPRADLAAALRRYAANLPTAEFRGLLDGVDEPAPDDDARRTWAWARLLAGWDGWRPHRLERRLLLPPPAEAADLAARCRDLAGTPAPARTPSLFARAPQPAPDAVKDILGRCAAALAALAAPVPPDFAAATERAVALGREVDDRLAALPGDWPALRLARAARPLRDWPPPPADPPADFLPALHGVVDAALARGVCSDAPALFRAVLGEALADLRSAGHLPTAGDAAAVFDRFVAPDRPVAPADWAAALGALLPPADGADADGGWGRLLARLVVRAAAVVPGIEPPVDGETLAVEPTWFRPGQADARYVVSPAPPRTVVRVTRFAVRPGRAEVVVSVGPAPTAATVWLTTPDPELLSLPDGAGRDPPARAREAGEAELSGRPPGGDGADLRRRWGAWLASDAGRDWFHALATLAATPAGRPAAGPWLRAVSRTAGVGCFPAVDPDCGDVRWPDEISIVQPGAAFVPGDAPSGVVAAVERFATEPPAARFRVSLGPDGAARAAAAAALAAAAAVPECGGVGTLLAGALDRAVRAGGDVPVDLLRALLDALARLDPAGTGEQAAARDALLTRARAWADVIGLSVRPAGWTFSGGGAAPGDDDRGVKTKAVFRRDVPAGAVARVKAFGLVGPTGAGEPGEVVVSAGPPPHGLTDLEAAAGGIPGAAGEEVRESFRALRPAGVGGYLELAAVDLYTRFWDGAYPAWAEADPGAAGLFGDGLRAMLAEGFGLDAFAPGQFRDYPPGWVAVPPGTRMTTGRVVRVLRPGLAAGDVLRVPARVEAV